MSEKKRVVAVCPDCDGIYWQEVPDGYDGPTKRPRRDEYALAALCETADVLRGKKSVYYRMRCSDCAVRLAPPAIRETIRKWLQVGEKK